MSDGYWREDVNTAVHILNRGQLRINGNKTPYELWFGRTPLVKYFKVFGSKCYIKRIDENLGKFDSRYDEGMFLWYGYTKNEYICYNIRLHKIVESADAKVDDLKIEKFKHQETIPNNEDEDDDELVDTQADVEEKDDTQEGEVDTRK